MRLATIRNKAQDTACVQVATWSTRRSSDLKIDIVLVDSLLFWLEDGAISIDLKSTLRYPLIPDTLALYMLINDRRRRFQKSIPETATSKPVHG